MARCSASALSDAILYHRCCRWITYFHSLAARRRVPALLKQQHQGAARMGLGTEFKEFAMKGNVIDLAVGVVIGAAFGKIVTSLVGDIIMPPLGLAIGGVDFKDWAV